MKIVVKNYTECPFLALNGLCSFKLKQWINSSDFSVDRFCPESARKTKKNCPIKAERICVKWKGI